MATTSKSEKIMVGIDNEVVELTGQEKEFFIADRQQIEEIKVLLEAEYNAKQDARVSAIKKLADIAGLTKEELASIL